MQWGVLVWMGLFATALGMFWWVKGSTTVSAGTLAVMNELHVPAGLVVNLLIWNRDADLPARPGRRGDPRLPVDKPLGPAQGLNLHS